MAALVAPSMALRKETKALVHSALNEFGEEKEVDRCCCITQDVILATEDQSEKREGPKNYII